ncbi:hypothetical protein [Cetobacterium sp.]|uniref:hypothetical protein n=1 Tax=Cetobacterium sp. TaxID=2071632 RepID=UPI003EE75D17
MNQEKVKIKKYLMGFDLLKVYEINHQKNIKLSLKHLTLLRWFLDFQGSNEMIFKVFDNKIYYWCAHEKIISDLPILEITSKDVISRLIRDLVKAEILESCVDRKDNSKTYIRLGIRYTELISSEHNQNSFDASNYTHKKRKIRLNSSRLKSRQSDDLKVGGLPTKKSDNRLVITIAKLYIDKTTTKHKSTLKSYKLSGVKELEKSSSSSSCEEIKKIKQLLLEKSLNEKTCNNILEAVKKNSLTLEKVKGAFEFAKAKNKGIGYVVDSLKFNWNNSLVAKPTIKKSDSIEKENQFIKKRELEKEEASKQLLPDVELTPKLEEELREKAITIAGIKPDVLNTMKNKSKKTYINTLKQFLTA